MTLVENSTTGTATSGTRVAAKSGACRGQGSAPMKEGATSGRCTVIAEGRVSHGNLRFGVETPADTGCVVRDDTVGDRNLTENIQPSSSRRAVPRNRAIGNGQRPHEIRDAASTTRGITRDNATAHRRDAVIVDTAA